MQCMGMSGILEDRKWVIRQKTLTQKEFTFGSGKE